MCFRGFNRQLLAVCKEVTLRQTIHIRSLIHYECVLLGGWEESYRNSGCLTVQRTEENFSHWIVEEEGEQMAGGLVHD